MEIQRNSSRKALKDVLAGEAFYLDAHPNVFYMKTDLGSGLNAIGLKTGILRAMDTDSQVNLVKALVVIE